VAATGRVPYGWRLVRPGVREPHPDEAPVVWLIGHLRENRGMTFQGIAETLNKLGIPAQHGGAWSKAQAFAVAQRAPEQAAATSQLTLTG
jgi:hypothetical protein